jgi:hypothetical protein
MLWVVCLLLNIEGRLARVRAWLVIRIRLYVAQRIWAWTSGLCEEQRFSNNGLSEDIIYYLFTNCQ